jgi:hypothetical protein
LFDAIGGMGGTTFVGPGCSVIIAVPSDWRAAPLNLRSRFDPERSRPKA